MSMEENDFENAAKKLMESEKAISDAKAEVEAASDAAAAEAKAAGETVTAEAKAAGEAAAAEAKAASDAATAEAKAATEVTSEETAAEMKSEADTIVENAVVNAEAKAEAAEAAINDDTVVLDANAIVDEPAAESATEATAEIPAAESAAEADGGEEVSKPELRLDDTTQTIDVDNISPDGSASTYDAGSVDNTTDDANRADDTTSAGFDAVNPQYEEHRYNYDEPVHPGYGAAYAQSQAAATKGFISKKAFAVILIIAMLLTMLASVGITTAFTTFMTNRAIKNISTSDDHATNYTLTQSDESLSYKSIIQKTQDSVVSITTESVTNDIWMQNYVTQGAGSGVIIESDGYIITCQHVIEGARKITVTTRDGKEYPAEIIGADADNDIAVIKIDATGLKAATYGDSSKLEVGDTTVVIGNPLGTLSGTVTTGIISALDRKLTIDNKTMNLLQTDASINPGNSGGGMFDASGNLIGIVEAKSTGSDIDGLGFATPINKAAKIAKELIENEGKSGSNGGSESTGSKVMIGIMITEVDDSVAQQYGYTHGGLLVRSVTSPQASMSGLEQGDIIFKAEGKTVKTQDDLTKILSKKKAGDKLKLTVARDNGRTEELTTVLISE